MRCKSMQGKLTLYLSDDLSRRLKGRVEKHLERCPACRLELQSLRISLHKVKQADLAERCQLPDWDEKRWSELMRRISTAEAHIKSRPVRPLVIRKGTAFRLAAAAGIVVLIVLAGILIRQSKHHFPSPAVAGKQAATPENRPEKIKTEVELMARQFGPEVMEKLTENYKEAEASARPEGKKEEPREKLSSRKPTGREKLAALQPEKIEMAFTLSESGVQVVWTLHRNFNLEGEKR